MLKFAHIRNVFRVHLIELVLQKINLLFQCLFAVDLFVGGFLRTFRLLSDLRELDKLIDCLLDQFNTLRP